MIQNQKKLFFLVVFVGSVLTLVSWLRTEREKLEEKRLQKTVNSESSVIINQSLKK